MKQTQPVKESKELVTRVKLVTLGGLEGTRLLRVVSDGSEPLLSCCCGAGSKVWDKGFSHFAQSHRIPFPLACTWPR